MILYNCATKAPGTALAFPYYGQMMADGVPGWRMLKGGMHGLTASIAEAAAEAGARILINRSISKLDVRANRCVRAVDDQGDTYEADYFIAACDPLRTARLLRAGGYTSKHWKALTGLWRTSSFRGMCGKANFTLRDLPRFRHLPDDLQGLALGGLVSNLRTLSMMDAAFASANRFGTSDRPYLEMHVPTVLDPSQGCGSHTILSVYFMFSAFTEKHNRSRRESMRNALYEVLEEEIEDFSENVVEEQLFTNKDLHGLFGFSRGNVDHGSLTHQYSFSDRGLPGVTPPRTDIANLYLGSAGSAPGGLVTGLPGLFAAEAVLHACC
jgi:phytoene dehydrogenase-like protein